MAARFFSAGVPPPFCFRRRRQMGFLAVKKQNKKTQTDHVIWEPMWGLKKIAWEGDKIA